MIEKSKFWIHNYYICDNGIYGHSRKMGNWFYSIPLSCAAAAAVFQVILSKLIKVPHSFMCTNLAMFNENLLMRSLRARLQSKNRIQHEIHSVSLHCCACKSFYCTFFCDRESCVTVHSQAIKVFVVTWQKKKAYHVLHWPKSSFTFTGLWKSSIH